MQIEENHVHRTNYNQLAHMYLETALLIGANYPILADHYLELVDDYASPTDIELMQLRRQAELTLFNGEREP